MAEDLAMESDFVPGAPRALFGMPEGCSGLDWETDIFAFGAVFFEMVTG